MSISRRTFVLGGLTAMAAAGLGGAAWAGYGAKWKGRGKSFMLENEHLLLAFDERAGHLTRIYHKAAGLDLLAPSFTPLPVRVQIGPHTFTDSFEQFAWERDGEHGLKLHWQITSALKVHVSVSLPPGERIATFVTAVENSGEGEVWSVEYPIVRGIGPLRPGKTFLAHPHATGFLIRDPAKTFKPGPGENVEQGIINSPYPEGFSGATMQFYTYYVQGAGGFYFATADPDGHEKWLDFYREADGRLVARFRHGNGEIAAGRGFAVPYPVQIGALPEGNWYEAAEQYKAWAAGQFWTRQGPLYLREARARWLLEETGLAVFGVNPRFDRSAYLDFFHQVAGKPVLHVTGPNWPAYGCDYRNYLPSDKPGDWFPAQFHPANVAAIRRNGDYLVPFEFNLILGQGASVKAREAFQAMPSPTLSNDAYTFPFVCPATEFLGPFHVWRDGTLVKETGADGVYYDISVNNVRHACTDETHGHPRGAGARITAAYNQIFAETRRATAEAAGKYVPTGTEMVNEVHLGVLDFYQARAEASPASGFEAWPFRNWIKAGLAEKIPLFAYVYHEYGPVRLDGWGQLATETGDLFYWLAARVVAWGGLYELNYEYCQLETVPGGQDPEGEAYADWDARLYSPDPDKMAFVRELALTRTELARDFLAYGTMLRPLTFDQDRIRLNFFEYNVPKGWAEYQDRGSLEVPAVVHAAWGFESRVAYLFANVDDKPRTVTFVPDFQHHGLKAGAAATLRTAEGVRVLGGAAEGKALTVTVAPRRVAVVEIASA